MLELLARLDVRATFFVLGEHAARDPAIVREMVAAGHDVQSHGYHHHDHLLRSPRQIHEDMAGATHVIGSITGTAPTCARPPHGVVTWATMRSARALDQQLVLWSRWGCDWRRRATVASIVRHSTRDLRGREILLLHDADWYGAGSARVTRDAVVRIVEQLRLRGLEPGPLSDATAASAVERDSL
jgi:peptidoglycan/xylan/chitin deacetylase (PgdA/CDA1 family)